MTVSCWKWRELSTGRLGCLAILLVEWYESGLCKKDPTQIIDPNVKYELKDVGKLGRALALHVYIGEAVWRESTPSGNVKCNLLPLDQEKLRSLVTFSLWRWYLSSIAQPLHCLPLHMRTNITLEISKS